MKGKVAPRAKETPAHVWKGGGRRSPCSINGGDSHGREGTSDIAWNSGDFQANKGGGEGGGRAGVVKCAVKNGRRCRKKFKSTLRKGAPNPNLVRSHAKGGG